MNVLVPMPRLVRPVTGHFRFGPSTAIMDTSPWQQELRTVLGGALGLPLAGSRDGTLLIERDDSLPEEGYVLDIRPDRISLRASSRFGVLWASQTLRQLLGITGLLPGAGTTPQAVPCMYVEDEPTYAWRGCLLDVARHFHGVRALLGHLDLMAFHKLNVLHLHLTDDQGWRLAFDSLPALTGRAAWRSGTSISGLGDDHVPVGGFYTRAQMQHIVAYAQDRGISIVPEIDLPGHATALLSAYPDMAVPGISVAEPAHRFGVLPNVIALTEGNLQTVASIWEEVLTLFPSRYVHIGGDEVEVAQWASPQGRRQLAELGIAGADTAQRWFSKWLVDFLTARGRSACGWDEILDTVDDARLICFAWQAAGRVTDAVSRGMHVVATPQEQTYFDYYQGYDVLEPYANDARVVSVSDVFAFDPAAGVDPADRHLVLGAQFQLWTEYMPNMTDVEYMAWPRGSAFAESVWRGPGRDQSEFEDRLYRHLDTLAFAGINVRGKAGPLPWQAGSGRRLRPPDHFPGGRNANSLSNPGEVPQT